MKESIIAIEPNADKLIESLRSTGYSNEAAIADLVDNSLDAGAKNIDIKVGSDYVIIADDGSGMDLQTLTEAMKLGSDTEHVTGDLGRFGMGMVTASISLGTKIEVTTRSNGTVHHAVQDLEYIRDTKRFRMMYSELASETLPHSGTILAIRNIDRFRYKQDTLLTRLHEELGRTFRYFLWSKRSITINGKQVQPVDPLMQDEEEARINSDETYEIAGKKFRVKVAVLPAFSPERAKSLKINQFTQGFYLVRNNREISSGYTFDLWTRHNRYNRIRIEMLFDNSLDEEMGIEFKKDNINPQQALISKLRDTVIVEVNHLVNAMQRAKLSAGDSGVDHTESVQTISSKSKLLLLPEVEKEKRAKKQHKDEPTPKPEGDGTGSREPRKVQPGGVPRVSIGEANLGRLGELFEAYPEGKKLVVNWNVDHPFYERMMVAYRDDKNVITAMDYLIYSLGAAEVQLARTDEGRETVDALKAIASQNIRTLIG